MSQLLKSEIPVLISFENKMLTTGKKSTKKFLLIVWQLRMIYHFTNEGK